ncbi:MAG: hypothetical protein WBB07_16475 [Mycobacterium sp.]
MADYLSLTHISVADLIGGGDPWRVDETLQSGDPGQIAELASAFQFAGGCTQETWDEWVQARERFHASWNRETGEHPIDESAEVQRATSRLFVQKDQLPLIAVDLQNIAADLAEAESQSGAKLDELNGQMKLLDHWVGQRVADDEDWSDLLNEAKKLTTVAFGDVDRIRDQYTDKLEAAAYNLRLKHGYDPAGIEDIDGDREVSPEERGRTAPEHYDANQRVKDEALVKNPGPRTPEKDAAEARLRDFATTRDPAASADSRSLAEQRLDDFRMANFVGPLPRDPLTGVDARERAQARLELQRQFEQGFYGAPPQAPDQATQLLNDGESAGRVRLTQQTYDTLIAAGMSSDGAQRWIGNVAGTAGNLATGARAWADGIPRGEHARWTDYLSPKDAEVFGKIAGRVTRVTDVVQLLGAAEAWVNGDEHRNEMAGRALGGIAGGTSAAWLAGLGAASLTGPWTTAALVIIAGAGGGLLGTAGGGVVGRQFD